MIRLKLNNKAELICKNTNKFDPNEVIKTNGSKVSALKAFGEDNRALSAEYQDNDGKISKIELIRDENKPELIEPKSIVEISTMKDLRYLLKKAGQWTKCKETILHFQ